MRRQGGVTVLWDKRCTFANRLYTSVSAGAPVLRHVRLRDELEAVALSSRVFLAKGISDGARQAFLQLQTASDRGRAFGARWL